jgi:aspartyl-tRNA(Asn)/glutamyl-tRNA(Gln) amidotransferase subunit B
MSNWDVVIGLEIHAQLQTASKVFAPDSAGYSKHSNENISEITMGYPGTLPVVNHMAIEHSIKIGLALNCKIKNTSIFARKHYFYPDLPKGYQISQFELPLCEEGYVNIILDGESKRVGIERAHMEEDAGKSSHKGGYSLIDYNRAGVPLLEIVSKPDMTTAKEAAEYARTIRSILRYLEVCDGNLEEGSMRCDCNVSLKPKGQKELGTKVEIKNINSFRFIEKALDYEIQRQASLLETGEQIVQETRLYDSTKNKTFSMRSKEEAMDYRYFPDPDLLPLEVTDEQISKIKESLPELPIERMERFQKEYGLPEYDSAVLTVDKALANFFEDSVKASENAKATSNWIMGDFLKNLKESEMSVEDVKFSPEDLGLMIKLIDKGDISGKMGKAVFSEMWETGKSPKKIVESKGLSQISDPSAVQAIVDKVVSSHPEQLKQYQDGKNKLFGFFVGQVMKESKGQANPEMVNKFLMERLKT